MSRRALALRHVRSEDLDAMEPRLLQAGFSIEYIDTPEQADFHAQALAADLLVVLGGPMSVYEQADYPFLATEIQVVRERLLGDRPVLGICLGAQIMAAALGARVFPGEQGKEVGWKPLNLTDAGRMSALAAFEAQQPVLHWHGDTFDLPAGAELLASTDLYPNQAFAYGRHGLAMQFHIEASALGLERWYSGQTDELAQLGIAISALRQQSQACERAVADELSKVLTAFVDNAFASR
jgi:GMP synthase (glutamine-hydrolysing)